MSSVFPGALWLVGLNNIGHYTVKRIVRRPKLSIFVGIFDQGQSTECLMEVEEWLFT